MTARVPGGAAPLAASLAAMLAACNSQHPPFPNAPPDAPVDALVLPITPDAAPGAVTVTVTERGAPVPGLAVYFQAADSSLVLAAATDAAGTASTVLAAGGYVTVIETPDPGTGATRLATFAQAQPGDALHIDLEPTGPVDAATVSITVPVPAAMDAASFEIDTSCGRLDAGATGAASGALVGCGGTVDLIAFARDSSGSVIGSLYAPDVAVAGQPVALTGDYTALVPTAFGYTGVPATSGTVTTLQTLATARGSLFGDNTSAVVDAGKAAATLAMPATSTLAMPRPAATAITVSEALPTDADPSEQVIFDWAPWTASYALDVAGAMLPPLAGRPAYDIGTRTASWVEGTGGTAPDLVRAQVRAFRDAIPEGRAWTWTIVAPRGGTSVAFPRFPGTGFDYTPAAGDGPSVNDLTIASVPGGYDAVRAHGFDRVQRYVTGPTGRMVVQTLHPPTM